MYLAIMASALLLDIPLYEPRIVLDELGQYHDFQNLELAYDILAYDLMTYI